MKAAHSIILQIDMYVIMCEHSYNKLQGFHIVYRRAFYFVFTKCKV